MNTKNKIKSFNKYLRLFVVLALFMTFFSQIAFADPAGSTIISNITATAPTYSPDNRTDPGGTITTLTLSAVQQNANWKAYLGNISGILTLDDSNGNSIYQWAIAASEITGEIYSSRASNPDWSIINCSNQTEVESEDTTLGFLSSQVDTINKTFNETTHSAITVAGRTIAANTCKSTATYVNDSAQPQSSAYFQESLFQSASDLVYVSPINYNKMSFNNNTNVDFQILLADDVTTASTTYYFFVEIGA